MSFNFSRSGLTSHEVEAQIGDDEYVPKPVKAYVKAGLVALRKRHGQKVMVNVSASGHLHNGKPDNGDTTVASISVSRAV